MGFVIPKEATIVEIEIFWIDEPYIYIYAAITKIT